MASFSKVTLTNSLNGRQILVNGTSSGSATAIHSAVTSLQSGSAPYGMDEIYLYATNNATSSLTCSILWGGTTEPNDLVRVILPPLSSRTLIADGKLLSNNLVVQAYAQVPGFITIDGFANRISTQYIPTNPEVSAWINTAYYVATASVDNTLAQNVDGFVSQMKASNIWNKMLLLNLFVTSSLNSFAQNQLLAQLPLVTGTPANTGGTVGAFNNINVPWQSSGGTPQINANGYSPNGNFYLNCNVAFSTIYANANSCSVGMSIYHSSGSVNSGMFGGCAPGFTDMFFMQAPTTSPPWSVTNTCILLANDWASPAFTGSASGPCGFYSFSRTAPTQSQAYRGNSTGFFVGSGSTAATAASTTMPDNLTVFQLQPLLNPLHYLPTCFLSFIAFHTGLSQTDTQNLFNAVQTFRQNLGGGFV